MNPDNCTINPYVSDSTTAQGYNYTGWNWMYETLKESRMRPTSALFQKAIRCEEPPAPTAKLNKLLLLCN